MYCVIQLAPDYLPPPQTVHEEFKNRQRLANARNITGIIEHQ